MYIYIYIYTFIQRTIGREDPRQRRGRAAAPPAGHARRGQPPNLSAVSGYDSGGRGNRVGGNRAGRFASARLQGVCWRAGTACSPPQAIVQAVYIYIYIYIYVCMYHMYIIHNIIVLSYLYIYINIHMCIYIYM